MEGMSIKETEDAVHVTFWANKPVVLTVFPTTNAPNVTEKEDKTAEAGEKAEMQPPAKAVKRIKARRAVRAKKHKHFKRVLSCKDVEYAAKHMGVFCIPHLMLTTKGNKTKRAHHRMACQINALVRRGLVKKTGKRMRPKGSRRPCVEYAWIGD